MRILFLSFFLLYFSSSHVQQECKELVLMTMTGGKNIYEITITNHTYEIKVYDITDGMSKREFVESFTDTTELIASDPYKSLLPLQQGRMLITQGMVDGKNYKLYDEQDYIEVYLMEDREEIWIKTLPKSDMENHQNFLKLVLRN